jgi:hypothetical protein
MKSLFTRFMVDSNRLNFNRWVFEPGMRFMADCKWWADRSPRGECHNGLDVRLYETENGVIESLPEGARIPVLFSGQVVKLIADFIGISVFVEHKTAETGLRLLTLYGHLVPASGITTGRHLARGAIVGTLAAAAEMKVPSHLHLSVVRVPSSISLEDLTWKSLADTEGVRFFDPLEFI